MKIVQANAGDFLKGPCGFIKIDHNSYVNNEMGVRIHDIDYDYPDYEPITPPRITEHGRYTAKVLGEGGPSGATVSSYLILTEYGGKFDGFRHRFYIGNYSFSIPIVFKSTDPRIGEETQGWHIRSGQFMTYVKSHPNGKWTFKTGCPATLNIDNGTSWIDVPSQ